jgi:hypothetical protein
MNVHYIPIIAVCQQLVAIPLAHTIVLVLLATKEMVLPALVHFFFVFFVFAFFFWKILWINTHCSDIDECATVPNICVKNDNCVNTIGSYYCNCTNRNLDIATNCSTCLPGYMRQDSQCIGIYLFIHYELILFKTRNDKTREKTTMNSDFPFLDMREPCKYHGTFNLTTSLCECNSNIFSSSTNCSSCTENHYGYPACLCKSFLSSSPYQFTSAILNCFFKFHS